MAIHRAAIALGANLGDRGGTLARAVGLLRGSAGIELEAVSSMRETRPVGLAEAGAPDFLNGAVALKTSLSAGELLIRLREIERELGRDRGGDDPSGDDVSGDVIRADSSSASQRPVDAQPSDQKPKRSRKVDLDLLLFGDEVIRSDTLEVPHPRMHVRRFVLEPLAEVCPEWLHPVLGKTVSELLRDLSDAPTG